jgi:NAD(P)H-hydrate epimerase
MKKPEINQRVLRPSALQTLRRLRSVQGDKRSHGHLFLLAGSRELGGAALMAAEASLKAGVGLLTVGIPESLHASFVAQLPEAMWIPLPETPNGCLALEGLGKIRQFTNRASAFAAGPGLGVEKETFALVRELCNFFKGPILLDADAIQAEILEKIIDLKRVVITPHAGELKRIVDQVSRHEWINQQDCTLVLKGSHTQIWSSQNCIFSLGGSSALARGGSGDILTGILGALLAKNSHSIPDSCCLGVQWHGRAAEVLARQHGQESIRTTEILSYLSFALRNDF